MKIRDLLESKSIDYTCGGNARYIENTAIEWRKETDNLIGCPKEIDVGFVANAIGLTSLEGAPKIVHGYFDVAKNQLTSLKGAPRFVYGDFDVSENDHIVNLQYFPEHVDGKVDVSFCGNLVTLEGIGLKETASLDASYCKKLKSFVGGPEKVKGNVDFKCTGITSFYGVPKEIGGSLHVSSTPITSLIGIEEHIQKIEKRIYLSLCNIKEGGIGLLLIDGLKEVVYKQDVVSAGLNTNFAKAVAIINDYLPGAQQNDFFDCQKRLVDAGLEAYAQI